jgi:Na+/proline symporter
VLISENLLRKVFRTGERKMLLLSRISTVGIALWALQMAFVNRHIHSLVTDSSVVGVVSLLVPFLVGFFTRYNDPRPAIGSMITGYIVWRFWPELAPVLGTTAADFPAAIAGLAGGVVPYAVFLPFRKNSPDTSAGPVSGISGSP